MPGYDTSPSGQAAEGRKGDMIISDAKAGSPKGASGAYSDAGNQAEPDRSTIARNFVNSHQNSAGTTGSTSDTGRMKP